MWYIFSLEPSLPGPNSDFHSLSAHLVYLQPYSPDFNPIEEAFFSIKAFLRRNEGLFMGPEKLPWLITKAVASITAEMADGSEIAGIYDSNAEQYCVVYGMKDEHRREM
ncbi:hypothetical protein B0H19DRAFT_941796 [Mycena capillaripes]|nr:hypothetical protein B0H19DRAFT_941796 [Mycena capillaripes]